MESRQTHIAILGGGPAGLAAAHYAQRASLGVELFEAAPEVGGNSRTIRFGEFLVDTGAHRLHDRDPETTAIARELLGGDLLAVDAPSRLYHDGELIAFPLAPLDLMRRLPAATLARIVRENIALRVGRVERASTSFGAMARTTYGATLAEIALLSYSRKLWGRDPDELMPAVAGTRLARLDLRTFLVESFAGRASAHRHLDGAFLYPRFGIGQLFSTLATRLGDVVHTSAPVTRIVHDGGRVGCVETAVGTVAPMHVVNTLPLGLTARLLDPAPPDEILDAARSITFRQLRLCVVLLARARFSPNASIYFPDPDIPFTRLYESKNRSAAMAPLDATSIVLEVPCERGERLCSVSDDELNAEMLGILFDRFGVHRDEVIGVHAITIPNAYPVLELAAAPHVTRLQEYLGRFANMQAVGRNASFRYTSIHDMFRDARAAVARIDTMPR